MLRFRYKPGDSIAKGPGSATHVQGSNPRFFDDVNPFLRTVLQATFCQFLQNAAKASLTAAPHRPSISKTVIPTLLSTNDTYHLPTTHNILLIHHSWSDIAHAYTVFPRKLLLAHLLPEQIFIDNFFLSSDSLSRWAKDYTTV